MCLVLFAGTVVGKGSFLGFQLSVKVIISGFGVRSTWAAVPVLIWECSKLSPESF